jgi:hypothetical protein
MSSNWQDLVTASLLGTERVPVPAAVVPGLPPQAGVDLSPDPAAELLDRAALATVARRAGRCPDRAEPLTMAGPDPAPTVSPAAGDRLRRILGGENPDLLTEWLTAVVARGCRAPAQLLPALLDRARRGSPADPDLRRLVAQAGGPRAQWLAGLNPDWWFVTAHARTGEEAWRLGDPGQRRGFLAALRAADPGAARDLIAASWATAGPERVMFVSVLADGLSRADEPLLEAALDDRAEDVRSWAAYLLASLPTSALGRRMAERARRFLRLEHGQRGLRLQVIAPQGADAAMRRDGIVPGPPVATGLALGGSHLADQARVMLEVVSRTPLETWTGEFALPPGQIVALPAGDWAPVLLAGWSRAATAQGRFDPQARAWMAALITAALAPAAPATAAQTAALRQLARRADPELGAPGQLPDAEPGSPLAVHGAIGVLRFRYEMLKELDG